MKHPTCVFLALLLTLAQTSGQSSELRTFTNASGKAIQARLVGVEGVNATIEMATGQRFTLAVTQFSAADQAYIKQAAATLAPATAAPAAATAYKPGPNDQLEPAVVNEFGAHPFSVAMYAENDKVTGFSLVFANKGDLFSARGSGEMHFDKDTPPAQAAMIVKKAMDKDLAAISATLTKQLGEPLKERFGEKAGRMNMQRWDWRGHSILLAEAEGEYVGIQIVTSAFADAGGKVASVADTIIRSRALANLEKREGGDVVIGDIPMVDQGPKGYCAPATAERSMRYLGIPADMYILANAGQTGFGGGTNVDMMLSGMAAQIRSKRRSFDSWESELKIKEIAKYIDKGLPVMWTLCSTKGFNDTANKRTKERKTVTDWAAWREKVTAEAAANSLPKDKDTRHIVLIIGYNKDTNEMAFSDSWGDDFKERWITLQEAEQVSDGRFYVVGF
ncbi:MAG: C39 family peptidase [Verrucomicrobiaceae bacterium]|nr:C39 family peptidase [Verrucomicrobiaceae bacterium]